MERTGGKAEPEPEPDEETVAAAGVTADEELVPLMAGEEELVPLAWEPLAEEELVACAFSISIGCDPHWIYPSERRRLTEVLLPDSEDILLMLFVCMCLYGGCRC